MGNSKTAFFGGGFSTVFFFSDQFKYLMALGCRNINSISKLKMFGGKWDCLFTIKKINYFLKIDKIFKFGCL
jgi:hypothetical protein